MPNRIGILAIGTFLPEPVRTNAFWSPEILREWQTRGPRQLQSFQADAERLGASAQLTLKALIDAATSDPFQGAVERHVMPDDMLTSHMETMAAQQAIERAGIDRSQIGVVLCHSVCPDYLNTPNACLIHKNLELDGKCFSMSMEGTMCNSFLMQLELAEQMVLGGRTRYALLIQSSGLTRFAPREQSFSPWFGDGATAVIVGEVGPELGLLGRATRTDGSLNHALVFGQPDKQWYADGPVVLFPKDPAASRRMLLSTAEFGRQIVHEALADAKLTVGDVDFYASHQPNNWFRPVSQAYIGLERAKSVDTFPWAGSLSGANIPLVLATAERDGLLKSGDLVAMYSGGSGTTYSGAILRWGAGSRERSLV